MLSDVYWRWAKIDAPLAGIDGTLWQSLAI
jgi:hypothetical protein